MHHHRQRIVLHIDDDEDDLMLVKEAIEAYDNSLIIRQVTSGDAALCFLRQSKEFHDLPCLIMLDMNMPRMTGREVLCEIKKDKALSAIPVVVFTTSSQNIDKTYVHQNGAVMVTKPGSYTELLNVVKKLLDHCAVK